MVEDDEDLCSGWKDLFTLLGYRLHCFNRSLEALGDPDTIAQCDLLITDYYLPDLNGVELVKRCRAVRDDLPAILLTGSKEDTVMTAARLLDHCRVLHKPVNIEDLDQEIRTICCGENARQRVWQSGDPRAPLA
jgi:two-component system phosphoglycerate transport system response regulator PgtA